MKSTTPAFCPKRAAIGFRLVIEAALASCRGRRCTTVEVMITTDGELGRGLSRCNERSCPTPKGRPIHLFHRGQV